MAVRASQSQGQTALSRVPTCINRLRKSILNAACQHLNQQGSPKLQSGSLPVSLYLASTHRWVLRLQLILQKLINGPASPVVQYFSIQCFALVWGLVSLTTDALRESFPLPSSSIVFLDVVPIGFQVQVFGSSSLPVQDLGVWDAQLKPLVPQGKDWYLCDPPDVRISQVGIVCVFPLARSSLCLTCISILSF